MNTRRARTCIGVEGESECIRSKGTTLEYRCEKLVYLNQSDLTYWTTLRGNVVESGPATVRVRWGKRTPGVGGNDVTFIEQDQAEIRRAGECQRHTSFSVG